LEIVADPLFWAVATFAVLLAGAAKGGMGSAGGVPTPIIALVIPPIQAATVMLPVLCTLDLFGISAFLGRWDRQVLRRIVAGGLTGALGGVLTFSYVNDNWIRVMVGVIALAYLAWSYWPGKGLHTPSPAAGWLWSALAGFTGFVTHAGSPPVLVYLLGLRMEKLTFAATSLAFFAVMNYAKILPYLWLGLFDTRNLATSALLVPIGVAGVYLGLWLQGRLDPRVFYRIVHVLLLFTGVKLLFDGVTGLGVLP
jgi:uncharacterized membrane protein YfcA